MSSAKLNIKMGHKTLAKNSLYSFMTSYGTQIFSLINSFLIARLITPELWGFLILATSYIAISGTILTFLPPGLNNTAHYYISIYTSENKYSNLKKFVKNSFILKIIFTIPTFIISVIIFGIFLDLFQVQLAGHEIIIFILSPIIIIGALNSLISSINLGFGMFKTLFVLLIVKYTINIGTLIFCLFLNNVIVEYIAFINLLTELFPFLINCIIIFNKVYSLKTTSEKVDTLKQDFQKSLKYGGYIGFGALFSNIWERGKIIGIGNLESIQMITGFNIANHYAIVGKTVISSLSSPLITSFSGLSAQNDFKQIKKIYTIFFKYSLFFLLLITGFLFFIADFFIIFVYGESYLIFSWILKINLFTMIFRPLGAQFTAYIKALNKVKYIPLINTVSISILATLFFLGLATFGIYGAIVGLLIANVIIFILQLIINIKIEKIDLDLLKILLQYLFFFISLFIPLILDSLIFRDFYYTILSALNLLVFNFEYIQFFPLITFLLMFLVLLILTKIFTVRDIEYVETLLNEDKKSHYFIYKILGYLKKIVRK